MNRTVNIHVCPVKFQFLGRLLVDVMTITSVNIYNCEWLPFNKYLSAASPLWSRPWEILLNNKLSCECEDALQTEIPYLKTLKSCMICCLCGILYSFTQYIQPKLFYWKIQRNYTLHFIWFKCETNYFVSLPNAYCASNFSVYHNFEYVMSIV